MRVLTILGAVAALALGTGSALAVTTQYDLTLTSGLPAGAPFTVDCAAAGILNNGGPCEVTYSANGIGVNGKPDIQPGQIDDIPGTEILKFAFALNQDLLGIHFGLFNAPPDDYDYSTDGGLSWANAATDNPLDFTLSPIVDISSLWIRASVTGLADIFLRDSFTVDSITLSTVPLPDAALLLGTGLAGMGLFAWSRKRRSAESARAPA